MSRSIVVVPCYNEANRLDARRFQEFAAASQGIEWLFVDDGSRDGTLGVLERLHAVAPRQCRYMRLARNSGKAEAVRHGVLAARADNPDYIGYWDADLATPLEAIPQFVRVLDERASVDVVVGSRMRLLGRAIERHPLRHALGRVFAQTAGLVLGAGIYDTQCGAKLFRSGGAFAQAFLEPLLVSWIFDVELFARSIASHDQSSGRYLEQAVYELPLDSWRDVAGSKVKPRDFFKAFAELFLLYWTYRRPGVVASPAVAARLSDTGHLPAEPTTLRMPTRAASERDRQRRAA